jgi:hypothetical protein
MDRLPSVWGQHDEALIDAMLIRGKLLTSIVDAPLEWRERLTSLGFRQTNTGWLKLGGLTPAEYSFLSPEIDLIGFRPESVLEANELEPDRVPHDVKDTLLGMWQRQRTMVMVALSMEHEVSHTRAQAWSFVEAALDGELTPETETLFGLTFTKMHRSPNGLSPAASRYVDELGWHRPASKLGGQKEAKLLFSKGETIEWMDSEGVLQSGRLARRMSVADVGGWVFQAPRWVGGYSVSTPIWVDRSRLHFSGSAQDWINDQQLASTVDSSPVAQQADDVPGTTLEATDDQVQLLKLFIGYGELFPPPTGVEAAFSNMKQHQQLVSGNALHLFTDENLHWLLDLESGVREVSQRLFGKSPIGLAVASHHVEIGDEFVMAPALTVAVRLGSSTQRSRSSEFEFAAPLIRDGIVAIGEAAQAVEERRYRAEKQLRDSSSALAKLVGSQAQHLMLASDFHGSAPMLWPKVSEFYDGHLSVDDIIRLQSVLMHGTNDVMMRAHSTNLVDAFEAYLYTAPTAGAVFGEVIVSVKQLDAGFVDLEAVKSRLAACRT